MCLRYHESIFPGKKVTRALMLGAVKNSLAGCASTSPGVCAPGAGGRPARARRADGQGARGQHRLFLQRPGWGVAAGAWSLLDRPVIPTDLPGQGRPSLARDSCPRSTDPNASFLPGDYLRRGTNCARRGLVHPLLHRDHQGIVGAFFVTTVGRRWSRHRRNEALSRGTPSSPPRSTNSKLEAQKRR